jgi:Skp family chaperone for outer membrane proteins
LEEATVTVKKLTKLDVPGKIRTDTINKFLEKGNVNYKPIFDALSKFTNDVEEILSKFQESLQTLQGTMENLSRKLRDRERNLSAKTVGRSKS